MYLFVYLVVYLFVYLIVYLLVYLVVYLTLHKGVYLVDCFVQETVRGFVVYLVVYPVDLSE